MFCINFRLLIFINYILVPCQFQSISVGWQSIIVLYSSGFEFSPIDNGALFLFEISADSLGTCAQVCHDTTLCRTIDFDDQSHRCRIFQGDLDTTGSIIPSSLSQSRVASIQLNPNQFANFGQPCSFCQNSRYLRCVNSTCQCQANTYFDGSICRSQKLFGDICTKAADCRIDRNYACLPRMQCGRKYYYSRRIF